MKPCLIFLTCSNLSETEKITEILLKKRLVSCVKLNPVNSSYIWKNKMEKNKEILLIMDSIEENYDKINTILKKTHSYETYTLFMVPVERLNKEALNWLKNCVEERT